MVSPVTQWRVEARSHDGERLHIRLLSELIDSHVQQAVIICTRTGEVIWANHFATSSALDWGVLEQRDGAYRISNPQLSSLLSSLNQPLNQPLDQPLERATTQFPSHSFLSSNNCFLEITVQSVNEGESTLVGLIIDCHVLDGCGSHSLAELTPAEYQLVKSLECHRCLKEAATDLHISYENARTKLKRIFEKLDIHSQRELMSKVHHVTD